MTSKGDGFIDDMDDDYMDDEENEDLEDDEPIAADDFHNEKNEVKANKSITADTANPNGRKNDHFEKTALIIKRTSEINGGTPSYIPYEFLSRLGLTDAKNIATFEIEYAIQQIIDSRSREKFLLPTDGIEKINFPVEINRKYGNITEIWYLDDFHSFYDQGKFQNLYNRYIRNPKK